MAGFVAAKGVAAFLLVVTTQNVRVGMPPDHVRHDIHQAAQYSSIVLTQEMGFRVASRYAPRGWGTAHRPGPNPLHGDCATYWSPSWHKVRAYTVPIARYGFRDGHRWALVTVLRGHGMTLPVVCVHVFTRTLFRPVAYANTVRRVSALAGQLRSRWGRVIVGGDWNHDAGRLGPLFRYRPAPARTGPKGGRPDWLTWSRGVRVHHVRVIPHTWSDHNGVRYRFRVR